MINIFCKILHIYIPALAKMIVSSTLNFELSKLNYIYQVFFFYVNAKTKLVEAYVTLQKVFTKTVEIITLQIIKFK